MKRPGIYFIFGSSPDAREDCGPSRLTGYRPGCRLGTFRSGRVVVTVLLVTAALVAGAAGGFWLPGRLTAKMSMSEPSGETASADADQWYTCGMHPNVLQKKPGTCPICQMKLTPLKKEGGDEGGKDTGKSKERKVLYWRAPMNPGFISEKPGKSPMGMDLVPVYADKGESASAHTIRIDPVTIQNMGIRTAKLRRGPLIKTIRTIGRVDYDEQLVTFINTKFEGWIEKLYVDETGQVVDKGQPLFDVYSPVLYDTQSAYLASLRYAPKLGNATFPEAKQDALRQLEADKLRLLYYDISEEQIAVLEKTKKIQKTMTIHSSAEGIVTEKMALEGMYIKPGMKLYTIADLSRVWVYVDIYEYQLPWVRVGQKATMTLPYIPGTEFKGKVVYIYPYLEKTTRVIKVRLEFDNPDLQLKPEMYANVTLATELQRDALLIPREAYIDSGKRQLAFVYLGDGKFAPRDIQVGVEAEGGMVEVLDGLDESEVIVTSGQFMLDAESKLKEAVAKMMKATLASAKKKAMPAAESMAHADHGAVTSQPATTMPTDAKFACPMEKHSDETDPAKQGPYFSTEPGKCPRCGMKLKPLDALSWTGKYKSPSPVSQPTTAPSGDVTLADAKFACPMEKHSDETDPAKQGPYFSTEPGKCPRCGMKLKPIDQLDWVKPRLAAKGAEVAYTCPDHQHVFSTTAGTCPRCGKTLTPFKVMYTCPDPAHAGVISTFQGTCPYDGQALTSYRGIWLDPSMAGGNIPPTSGPAAVAAYQCPTHPLVHSDHPGKCTICAADLKPTAMRVASSQPVSSQPAQKGVPSDATYTCPMHPDKVHASKPGPCPICAMQLVPVEMLQRGRAAPQRIAAQIDYITEHYLALQRLLASDRTTDVALHTLGMVAAAEQAEKHLGDAKIESAKEIGDAIRKLRDAALKIKGISLEADRVTFVDLSQAMRTLIQRIRPDKKRWPKLYIFHCPMSKGDWIQTTEGKANPYYGFKMLKCGELKNIK